MNFRRFMTAVIGFCITAGTPLHAQSVDELIEKYVRARGGYDKIKALKTLKIHGKQIEGGMEIAGFMIKKRPNLVYIEAEEQGQKIQQVFDGETAWQINPLNGIYTPQNMPENEALLLLLESDFDGVLVDFKKKGHQVEYAGREEMEGTEVHKFKVVLKTGQTWFCYLDTEHSLELKRTVRINMGTAEYDVDIFYSDFKEVDGLIVPFVQETKMGGYTIAQVVFDTIKTNMKVDDTIFRRPVKEEE